MFNVSRQTLNYVMVIQHLGVPGHKMLAVYYFVSRIRNGATLVCDFISRNFLKNLTLLSQ